MNSDEFFRKSTPPTATVDIIDPAPPSERLAAAGALIKDNLQVLIQNAPTIARLRRANYLAYIAAGFSEKQALELCCK